MKGERQMPREDKALRVNKSSIAMTICTEITRGDGSAEDPVRLCRQYWTLDGHLIAELDSRQAFWICSASS